MVTLVWILCLIAALPALYLTTGLVLGLVTLSMVRVAPGDRLRCLIVIAVAWLPLLVFALGWLLPAGAEGGPAPSR